MSDDKFQNKYRIPWARAGWHNYNGGTYFVTICTHAREHYFGEIQYDENGEAKMFLSEIGKFAEKQFRNVKNHYPYADIPLWVIMPDHIHAIVNIDYEKTPYDRRDVDQFQNNKIRNMGTTTNVEPRCTTALHQQIDNTCTTALHRQIANMQGWLSVTIGGIKRAITHFANQNQIPFAWQSRFYDRIVRDTTELNRIAVYIENNVAQWAFDNLNNNRNAV